MSLSQKAIAKNNELRQTIEEYYENLKRELDSLNSIIGNVEKLSDNDFQVGSNDKWCLHADGAYKPIGAVELGHALKPQSPFYEEAARQERYLKFILPNPLSTAERRYLEKAVVKENKRLMALRLQQNGQNPLEVLPTENEAYLDNTEGLDWSAIARDVSTWNHPGEARTPQECKSRWLTQQHPKLNYEDWTDEETKMLREIVQDKQRFGSLDWDVVSESLGTNRIALDCIKQYQAHNKTTLKWTEELDKRLLAAVEKYGYSNWALVAPAVSLELSPNQCQIRYERTLNPTLKHGKFTPEEDEMLLKAVEFHGCEWKKVALMVFGRSNTQCRSRWLSLDRRKEKEKEREQQSKNKSKKAEVLGMEHASTSTPIPPVPVPPVSGDIENATAPTAADTMEEKESANDTTRVVSPTEDAPETETQLRRVPKARPVIRIRTSTVEDTEPAIDTTGMVLTTGDAPEVETETGTGTEAQLPRKVLKARPAKETSKSVHPMRTRTRTRTTANPE